MRRRLHVQIPKRDNPRQTADFVGRALSFVAAMPAKKPRASGSR